MSDFINCNSSDLSTITNKMKESLDILESGINRSISSDFNVLKELDLFVDGLKSLENKTNTLINLNQNLLDTTSSHINNLENLEKKHVSLIENNIVNKSLGNYYSGEKITIDKITLDDITDGKSLLNKYVTETIFSFSYDKKLEVLKSILNDDKELIKILTDDEEKDILIHQLKDVLDDKYDIKLDELKEDEEKEIQKNFFESIADNDTNIFNEVSDESLLNGLSYYKDVARKNGISVSDLIFDEKNNNLFLDSLKDIYENNEIDLLNEDEINGVKKYIDNISYENNISSLDLLSDTKYISLLKGGIYYEN